MITQDAFCSLPDCPCQKAINPIVMRIGLVPVPGAPMQMWYLPNIIQGYLVTGSISGVILVIVLFIVSYLIWQPFFKVYEKQQYEEENGGAKAQ